MAKLTRGDYQYLRQKFDGNDPFFNSCGIKKERQTCSEVPGWALNNAEIQKVLLRAFPKPALLRQAARESSPLGYGNRLIFSCAT